MTNRLPHQALTPGPTEPGRNRGWNVAVVPGDWIDFTIGPISEHIPGGLISPCTMV